MKSPESFVCEGFAGVGFQIFFKCHYCGFFFKCEIGDQVPWLVFCSVVIDRGCELAD
jgi:hypothetical protein